MAVADACLVQPILVLQNDKLVVNLHTTIPLLIREAKSLAKLDIELPIVAATLMVKQNHFHTIQDSLNVSILLTVISCMFLLFHNESHLITFIKRKTIPKMFV